MLQLSLSHSQKRGAFCSSADVTIAYCYWVKHPVLLDSRPADCVTTSASNTGCFVMTAKDGKPCRKCGGSKWYKNGKCAACAKAWRQNNKDKEFERGRARRERDREKIYENNRRWKKENPVKIGALKHRRETRKTEAGGSYTAAEWNALVEHYGGKCLCCGRDNVALTVDHITPVAKGGTSNIDNLQPLCLSCNSSKGTQIIDYRPDTGLGRWIQRKLFR